MEQRLVQSPQMIQAMKILQLPAMDLLDRIQQELDENPVLELAEPEPQPDAEAARESREEAPADGDAENIQKLLEAFDRLERDYSDGSRQPTGDGEEGDRKLAALQNTPDLPRTMAEAITEELAFLDLSPRERALADFLVYSLDDRGYLPESLEELAAEYATVGSLELEPGGSPESAHDRPEPAPSQLEAAPSQLEAAPSQLEAAPSQPESAHDQNGSTAATGSTATAGEERTPPAESDSDEAEPPAAQGAGTSADTVTPEELAAVLEKLRDLIHPGLGARDLGASLLLQLEAMGEDTPLLISIVRDHFEDLTHNRLPRIAKATGHSIEEVNEAIEQLKRLDRTPCADYGESQAAVILPDVIVEYVDGDYVVRLDRQRVPELTLSRTYRDMLAKAAKGDPVEGWIKKHMDSARWFIDAVTQRQSTLERIAKVIFVRQRPFLDKGLQALQTLRMQEVADEVGVHISTVSRAVSGKYAQTPRGIYTLKFFFTGGTTNDSGEVTSQVGIQQRIKELIDQEDPAQPLSDEEIAQRLKDKNRIEIARRTVTKYRKMLSIPASSQRKRF